MVEELYPSFPLFSTRWTSGAQKGLGIGISRERVVPYPICYEYSQIARVPLGPKGRDDCQNSRVPYYIMAIIGANGLKYTNILDKLINSSNQEKKNSGRKRQKRRKIPKINSSTSVECSLIKATPNTLRWGWHRTVIFNRPVAVQSFHRSPHSDNHERQEALESQNSS